MSRNTVTMSIAELTRYARPLVASVSWLSAFMSDSPVRFADATGLGRWTGPLGKLVRL